MSMAYIYANLVEDGDKSIEDVPDYLTLRQDVQTVLDQRASEDESS